LKVAYVDGSYLRGIQGYGLVILEKEEIVYKKYGALISPALKRYRNVAPEIKAVLEVLKWAKENSIKGIKICYDYTGLEKWATGEWKAKNNLSKHYQDSVNQSGINIHWQKVKAHSDNYWNEYVDRLARGVQRID